MRMKQPIIPSQISRIFTAIILIHTLLLAIFVPAMADKTPVTLSISTVPDAPALNHGFHVTGALTTASGEALGNKRVTLESSQVTPGEAGSFAFIALSVTNREGIYDFFRPKYSLPEYLHVTYAGNELYEPAISPVLPVRGAGTDNPQRMHGTGSLTVSTDPIGAGIYIDSEFRGTSPSIIQGLEEGAHQVELYLEGYQNETMEVFASPDRGSTFSITLTPEGYSMSSTGHSPSFGLSSSLSYAENDTVSFGDPVFSLDNSGLSMALYANATGDSNVTRNDVKVTTVITNDTIGDGYDIMVIMTDH